MKRWGILPCNGLDKPAGQLAREIALNLAEDPAKTLACPVFMHSAPSVYTKVKEDTEWLVLDGCNTRCASKLATEIGLTVRKKVNMTELAGEENIQLGRSLRLDDAVLEFAKRAAGKLAGTLSQERPVKEDKTSVHLAEGFGEPLVYEEFRQDKFRFRVPQGNFYFNENDCWVWIQGSRARVGVSDYVQQSLSDIMFFSPPEEGTEIELFGTLGSLESSKAVFEIISPVACKVVAVNEDLETSPEWINENPYEKGWIAEIELTDWEADRELLLDAVQYLEYLKNKVADFHV